MDITQSPSRQFFAHPLHPLQPLRASVTGPREKRYRRVNRQQLEADLFSGESPQGECRPSSSVRKDLRGFWGDSYAGPWLDPQQPSPRKPQPPGQGDLLMSQYIKSCTSWGELREVRASPHPIELSAFRRRTLRALPQRDCCGIPSSLAHGRKDASQGCMSTSNSGTLGLMPFVLQYKTHTDQVTAPMTHAMH